MNDPIAIQELQAKVKGMEDESRPAWMKDPENQGKPSVIWKSKDDHGNLMAFQKRLKNRRLKKKRANQSRKKNRK